MSPAQARAARALLGWSQAEVASKIGFSEETIHDFEAGYGNMPSGQVEALKSALTTAGILFSNGSEPGVSLSRRGRDEGTRADDLTTENDR
ncbi:XRE family transcriptional regulator [Methylobacterium sp. Leaf399]|nr:XRE family transcriptional regulator [Methylobacterium sp. Leaf108]KQT12044.1 XRE family transcriptional regulator [Methylobacterium sp. Leaf399]KQT84513.1 XRE family transcriptional regulator [Methylobacterium sp. Leaf466]